MGDESSQKEEKKQYIQSSQHNYEIIRTLGEGGMGSVYLVQADENSEPAALKFLHSSLNTEHRIQGFKREFALLTELHHPHVCRVFDFGFSPSHEQYFFTAEVIEGQELYDALRLAPIEDIERAVAQMLSALDFIHTLGLIHFDVKGANVLVGKRDGKHHSTLVDFGVTAPVNNTKEIAGTLFYMAPELMERRPKFDQRVDLYSLGIVCYHLLTGIYPYEVHSLKEAQEWHANHEIDFAPLRARGAPTYICDMVELLLKRDPDERFASAKDVIKHLSLHSGHAFIDLPSLERAQLVEGPFIGRDDPIATLSNAIKRTVAHLSSDHTIDQEEFPQAYVVAAGRGMGKSRLLKEMKYTAQLEDCATWVLDGEREGRDLAQFIEALRLDIPEDEHNADHVAGAMMTMHKERACCLLIDNIDRAGPNVQKTINALLGKLYSASLAHTAPPLIVVITQTPEPGVGPTNATGAPVIELEALSEAFVRTYVEQLVGDDDDIDAFTEAVWDFSHGTPLLMTEAARWYHQEPGGLPSSIEDLFSQQVARLETPQQHVVELLSYANVPLSADEIDALIGSSTHTQREALQTIGMIRFHQDLHAYLPGTGALQQAIAHSLPDDRRTELANILLQWNREQESMYAYQAVTFAMDSDLRELALEVLDEASQELDRMGENERVIEVLHQRCKLLEDDTAARPEIVRMRRKMATMRLFLGQYQACEEIVHGIAAMQGEPEVDDLKMLGLAKRAQRQPKEAGVFYDQALTQLAEDHSNPTYLFILNERAQAYIEEGALQQGIDIYQKSYQWTKQLAADKRQQVTNNNLGIALAQQGKFEDAVTFYEDKLEEFAEDKRISASVYGQMGMIQLHAGATAEALHCFTESWERSLAIGSQHNALALLENIIALHQKTASYTEALTYAQKSFEIRAAGAAEQDLARSLRTISTLYLTLGLPDLSARYLTQAMRLARKSRQHELLGWIHITFGYLYKDLGRMMEALNAFEETIALGEQYEDDSLVSWGCYGAVDLLTESGEIEEATPFLKQLDTLMPEATDPEFLTRYELLQHKMTVTKHPRPNEDLHEKLVELSKTCEAQQWEELYWETEYLIGVLHQKRNEMKLALTHMAKADQSITEVAAGLAPEYRENFTSQRARARVRADLITIKRLSDGHSGLTTVAPEEKTSQAHDGDGATIANIGDTMCEDNDSGATFVAETTEDEDVGNTIVGAVIDEETAPTDNITPQDLLAGPIKTFAQYEREILQKAHTLCNGNHIAMADALGLNITELRVKLAAHDIK